MFGVLGLGCFFFFSRGKPGAECDLMTDHLFHSQNAVIACRVLQAAPCPNVSFHSSLGLTA